MKLSEYLEKKGILPSAIAKRIGVHRNTIHMIIKHHRVPQTIIAHKILQFTDGQVTPEDFIRDQYEHKLATTLLELELENFKKKNNETLAQ